MAATGIRAAAQTPRWYAYLVIITVVATYVLILLGGYVKATHAGLACPEWPTCEGDEFFSLEDPEKNDEKVWAEVTHRVVASFVVGPLVLLGVILAWYLRTTPAIRWLAFLSLPLLGVQVWVGGVTVTSLLEPIVVTSHLGLATAFFTIWVIIAMLAWRASDPRSGGAAESSRQQEQDTDDEES